MKRIELVRLLELQLQYEQDFGTRMTAGIQLTCRALSGYIPTPAQVDGIRLDFVEILRIEAAQRHNRSRSNHAKLSRLRLVPDPGPSDSQDPAPPVDDPWHRNP